MSRSRTGVRWHARVARDKLGSVRKLQPPIEPMLARLSRELPEGRFVYEPKWDGFRCLAFCGPEGVDLRSRHGKPFARYFPEIVQALEPRRAIFDG